MTHQTGRARAAAPRVPPAAALARPVFPALARRLAGRLVGPVGLAVIEASPAGGLAPFPAAPWRRPIDTRPIFVPCPRTVLLLPGHIRACPALRRFILPEILPPEAGRATLCVDLRRNIAENGPVSATPAIPLSPRAEQEGRRKRWTDR